MVRAVGIVSVFLSALLLLGGFGVLSHSSLAEPALPQATDVQIAPTAPETAPPPAPRPVPPPPPTPEQALQKGTLIVISLPSQRLYAFQDGAEWDSTPVSTGKRGYGTPTGTFPILQKHVRHRSRTYNNASMPYMQRLTWGGVALHAGRVPGYPASHGCIRLPWEFARRLYGLTNPATTSVLIVPHRLASAQEARNTVGAGPLAPPPVQQAATTPLPAAPAPPAPVTRPTGARIETIQLAASSSAERATTFWQQLSQRQTLLQSLNPAVIPATVNTLRVFRLRASGPAAHAICGQLVNMGIACTRVTSQ